MSITLSSPMQLPLSGSALIEASAGTGKTFTIAALYVRFILAHLPRLSANASRPQALLPADILVVTFTKAATAELKDRIRKRLVEAAALFRGTEPSDDPFLMALKADFAPTQWPECAYALQMASEAMDEASVKTIHSWCQSVLREHAFSCGSLFNQQLMTDLTQVKLEAARDYWRNFIYPLNASQLQQVSAHLNGPEALLQRIIGLWDLAVPCLDRLDFQAMLLAQERALEQKLLAAQQEWQQRLPRWFTLIEQATAQGWFSKPKTHNSNKAQQDFAVLRAWLDLDAEQALTTRPKLGDTLLKNYGKEFLAHYTGPALTEDFPSALLSLAQLCQQQPDICGQLLPHAVSWCKAWFQQQLQRDAVIGFDDIIQQTQEAVCGPAGGQLVSVLQQQYPVALIDEFQDTDPAQYRIFNAIYQLAENRADLAVFLIGDPKQAIYAFRGADIYTYLQARRDTAGRHYTLAMNFRSSRSLVNGANALFLAAEQREGDKAFLFNSATGNQVPFLDVTAKGVKETLLINGQPHAQAITLWTSTFGQLTDSTETLKPINKSLYRQSQAQHFSDYIATLLSQAAAGTTGFTRDEGALQPLKAKDIAILVSTHKEGHLMQQALRKRGLASVYLSDRQSVFDTEVARELLLVLHACVVPGNRKALLNALYTSLLQVPLAELDQLQYDDLTWDQRVGQFYQFAACWQQQGVLAMIRQVIQQFAIAERLLSAAASAAGIAGERVLTDLLHLAEVLQQAAAKLDGPQAVLRFLHEHIYQRQTLPQASDEQIVRLESDAELIQIVTIHKSKGLEYPLVFLPFISNCRPVNAKDSVFNYHDSDANLRQQLTADAAVLAQADRERLGEDIRKLYVALTRAKYACWASLAPVGSAQNTQWCNTAWAHLVGLAADSAPDDLLSKATQVWANAPICITPLPQAAEPQYYQPASTSAEAKVAHVRQMPLDHRFKTWWVASYSALKYGAVREVDSPLAQNLLDEQEELAEQGAQQTQTAAATAEPMATLHDFPRGAGPGTFLHNILQDAADEGFAVVAEQADVRAALLAKRCRYGSWLKRQNQLDQWLASYLKSVFLLPDGQSCCLAALTHYKAEPEFWFAVNGISTAKLDLLVCQHVLPGQARPALQANYLHGMLKGFIDLLFEYQGRYYVADYKSNYLGPDHSAYSPAAMRSKILSSRYDLQYVLYTLALHKLLKARLKTRYCYDTHVGGIVYLFLRGHHAVSAGAFIDKPPRVLIEALDQYLLGATEQVEESLDV